MPKTTASGRDQDLLLYLHADQLNDLEQLRISLGNRLTNLTDQTEWGKGVDPNHPDVAHLHEQYAQIVQVEKHATRMLERAMKAHYLGPWMQRQRGVGAKQLARLLACIGNPAWNETDQRPRRGPAELWAYCGLHVIGQAAPRRARGQKANWSTDAKTRVYLIATSCMKQPADAPWRQVYDRARAKYADATHPVPCARCGPAGKPALAGTPLSAGHQHARALRIVSKELLKELWREARDLEVQA